MATKNDIAWDVVAKETELLPTVLSGGLFKISAPRLKEITGREPRLLAKIDHEENKPILFKEHGLSIVAVSSSEYVIGGFQIFQKLPEWNDENLKIHEIAVPDRLETLDTGLLTSESTVLTAAMASDIIADFCGEEIRLTLLGKMRTSNFDFQVGKLGNQQVIRVKAAQIEIDGGFEGDAGVYLFELKNHFATNFNLRQIYYPYRTWSAKVKKPVKNIFMTHTNDVFDLYEYGFSEPSNLESVGLLRRVRYRFTDSQPKRDLIIEEVKKQSDLKWHGSKWSDNKIPFPQADSFERVIDIVEILSRNPHTKEGLTLRYAFDARQTDYYLNAARFLGLVEETDNGFETTQKGREIFGLSPRLKIETLISLILSIPPAGDLLLEWIRTGTKPTIERAVELVTSAGTLAVNTESTLRRRTQTLLSWVSWAHRQAFES